MNIIVSETNKYASLIISDGGMQSNKMARWTDTTKEEMYSFFALLMLMPHVKKSRISEYWSKDELIWTDIFPKYMRRDRFLQLLRSLHFEDNKNINPDDRIWKIRKVLTLLTYKFSNVFYPFQKLVIDESLILFKGRLIFKQYIPSKRHRFGIKLFVMCDCETGIVLDIIVYTGTDVDIPKDNDLGFSGAVVKKFMENYENKGHILYTDNWYISPNLCMYLHNKNIGSCGTVRKNRKHFPKFQQMKKGDNICKKSGNLLAVKWQDKREVHMLTTFHKGKMVNSNKVDYKTGEIVQKPDIVIDYTKNMRMVDKSDMQITTIECVRKSVKWYKKFFFHLMDIIMLNSFNMYLVKTGNNKVVLKDFSRRVIRKLLSRYGTLTAMRPGRQSGGTLDRLSGVNFMERHSLEYIPAIGKRKKGQHFCPVCAKRNKRTKVTQWCAECKVGLCIGECYRLYHTRKDF